MLKYALVLQADDPQTGAMLPRDRALALLVAIAWGVNFIATSLALDHFPPLFMVALRYALLAIPTILFIPRPAVRLRWLLVTGLGIGALQFAFLYLGLAAGMPVGLASVVIQASAPFTVILGAVLLREKLSRQQVIGISVAVLGLAVIAAHRAQVAALLPVLLVLAAGLGWAIGTIGTRQAKAPNALHFTLWVSIVPPIPLLGLSLLVEGPERIGTSLSTLWTLPAVPAILGLAYVVLVSTVFGYGAWSTLLAKYPSSTVAPFSMLVPPVGVLAAFIVFGEVPDAVELIAGAFVVLGVLYASARRRSGTGKERLGALVETPVEGLTEGGVLR